MSVQSAPFLTPGQKYILQSSAFTQTSQVSKCLPVDLWRQCNQQADINQPNTNSSTVESSSPKSRGGKSTSTQPVNTTSKSRQNQQGILSIQEASNIISLCQSEQFGPQFASVPATSSDKTTINEGEEDTDNVNLTPLCVAQSLTPTHSGTNAIGIFEQPLNQPPTAARLVHPFFTVKSMAELLDEEEHRRQLASENNLSNHIVTFSEAIDELCGGKGIECGCVTELIGAPGMGKTQLSMQLAVGVQLPKSFGGVEGECLYIDTEGSFVPSRFKEIAAGAAAQVQKIVQLQLKSANLPTAQAPSTINLNAVATSFTVDNILKRVHYIRITRLTDLLALIESLPLVVGNLSKRVGGDAPINKNDNGNEESDHTKNASKIKLIIIDSIAFHFRYALGGDAQLRSRTLFHVGQTLQKHADKLGAAIVVTNQLTSSGGGGGATTNDGNDNTEAYPRFKSGVPRLSANMTSSASQQVPALGDSWAHTLTYRLWIKQASPQVVQQIVAAYCRGSGNSEANTQQQEQRLTSAVLSDQSIRAAHLLKAPTAGRTSNLFRITTRGVRNVNLPQYTQAATGVGNF